MTQHPTIDRVPALTLFSDIMHPDTTYRVLRLLGEAKMGKSHLLTKIFPAIARRQYNTECAVVDLRNGITVSDILHNVCTQMGGESRFPAYFAAYADWTNRPAVEVKGLQALLSSISVKAGQSDDPRRKERLLVTKFLADLTAMAPSTLLLMFDAVEQSDPAIQTWLMHDLLPGLTAKPHIRVVVAGRTLPDAAGSYAAYCHTFQLTPVEDESAYIDFCRELNLPIGEQSIKDVARVLDHKPGLFVELVLPKFGRRGVAHG